MDTITVVEPEDGINCDVANAAELALSTSDEDELGNAAGKDTLLVEETIPVDSIPVGIDEPKDGVKRKVELAPEGNDDEDELGLASGKSVPLMLLGEEGTPVDSICDDESEDGMKCNIEEVDAAELAPRGSDDGDEL